MPQRVDRYLFLNPGFYARLLYDLFDGPFRQVAPLLLAWKQPLRQTLGLSINLQDFQRYIR